jgi:hypothetical protein
MSDNDEPERKYHRFRFYPKTWSTLDSVEPCNKPDFCIGCEYNHPFCSATGNTIPR